MECTFNIENRSRIHVGPSAGLLDRLLPEGRTAVVIDRAVAALYPGWTAGRECFEIEASERRKTLRTAEGLCRRLMRAGFDRSAFLLGVGGGIVTDIAGFVAATYLRGVRFGFVPTTLLGQVDAAVGGKNGVNLDRYKNMVGTIRQPEFVLCDPAWLATLPEREFRSGLAEAVKSGIVGDAALFARIEAAAPETLRRDTAMLQEVVAGAVGVKAAIVGRDESEAGERRLLNLGHTLGHAIEHCSDDFSHGEAVAAGMAMISRAAVRMGLLDGAECARIVGLLERLGFRLDPRVPLDRLLRAAAKDKKRQGDAVHVILPRAVGRCEVRPMTLRELGSLLA
ncbi:MAG: 3-dehydroquinate synthase [Alistipes sp.]|nr:3-dehydroquinate synthase [Alistipes sp.]